MSVPRWIEVNQDALISARDTLDECLRIEIEGRILAHADDDSEVSDAYRHAAMIARGQL